MMRRRRPLARGAMVAGAGYAVAKSGSRKQAAEQSQNQRIADQQAQIDQLTAQQAPPPPQAAPAPAPAPAAAPAEEDRMDQLVKLKGLLDAGVLSDDEFAAEKARILAS